MTPVSPSLRSLERGQSHEATSSIARLLARSRPSSGADGCGVILGRECRNLGRWKARGRLFRGFLASWTSVLRAPRASGRWLCPVYTIFDLPLIRRPCGILQAEAPGTTMIPSDHGLRSWRRMHSSTVAAVGATVLSGWWRSFFQRSVPGAAGTLNTAWGRTTGMAR